MHFTDHGYVLSLRRHGEASGVLHLLTAEHGLHAGLVRGAFSVKNRATFQMGNLLTATWSARLADHLGLFACEPLELHAARLAENPLPLAALTSACALLESTLPERHPELEVFAGFGAFMHAGAEGPGRSACLRAYAELEYTLLHALGFGLDLTCCALTGAREDLAYVSPKTGRACTAQAGALYKDKLLPLPRFLADRSHAADTPAIAGALRLTGHFLEQWWFTPHQRRMPPARERLMIRIAGNMERV